MRDFLLFLTPFLGVAAVKVATFVALLSLAGCDAPSPECSSTSGSAGGADAGQCRPATGIDCPGPVPFTCKGLETTPGELTLTVCEGPPPTDCQLLYECPRESGIVPLWCCK
jgi:hypothetical protein